MTDQKTQTVADFLKALPTADEIRKQLEQNAEERKQLQRLLKIVENS